MCKLIKKIMKWFVNNQPEVWMGAMYHKDTGEVEDWSHKIEVSNLGNVRFAEGNEAKQKNRKPYPTILHRGNCRGNYRYISFWGDGKGVQRRIHRMVLSTFRPLPLGIEDKMDADHIDYDQTNNKLSNLQWMDRKTHSRRRRSTSK